MSEHDGERVSATQLLLHPRDYDGRRVTVEGLYSWGMEHCLLVGAWVEGPEAGIEEPQEWSNAFHGEAAFVRITGLWSAKAEGLRGFGHWGLYKSCLFAERIEEIPAQPRLSLGPGQLRPLLDAPGAELIEALVPIAVGHDFFKIDDLPPLSVYERLNYEHELRGRDPVELTARLLIWIERGTLHVLSCEDIGLPREYPVPRISVAELPGYTGQIVDVEGLLEVGEYWPRLGPYELIPPEITTTERYYEASYYANSPPEEAQLWRQRIEAAGGSLPISVRATVLTELGRGKQLSAYGLRVQPR